MAGIYIDTYHAGKEPKESQAFRDSIPPLHPNESTNALLTQNTINDNFRTHENNSFEHMQPFQIGTGGVDWTDFSNASGAGDWNSLYYR